MTGGGNDILHRQLIRLGDMMGDGQHLEPGGKWIEREYAQILKALGVKRPARPRDAAKIDARMVDRIKEVPCACGGALKQARKGSMVGVCQSCGAKYQLLRKQKTSRGKS
jgi:hypothetical protein